MRSKSIDTGILGIKFTPYISDDGYWKAESNFYLPTHLFETYRIPITDICKNVVYWPWHDWAWPSQKSKQDVINSINKLIAHVNSKWNFIEEINRIVVSSEKSKNYVEIKGCPVPINTIIQVHDVCIRRNTKIKRPDQIHGWPIRYPVTSKEYVCKVGCTTIKREFLIKLRHLLKKHKLI